MTNTTLVRLSMYGYKVSGFLYSACVLKLKQLFAVFLWPRANRYDWIRTARVDGCEGKSIHGVCYVGRYCGRKYRCGKSKSLGLGLAREWDRVSCCSVVKAEAECGSRTAIDLNSNFPRYSCAHHMMVSCR
jgi:hypothetical protein